MRTVARAAGAVLVMTCLFLGFRFLQRGTSRDQRVRLLGAEADLLDLRLEVLNYAEAKGTLPGILEDTLTIRGSSQPPGVFEFHRPRGQQAVDAWRTPLVYERDPDGAGFWIRSAGPDGNWNTTDDLIQKGRAGEDAKPVYAELKAKLDEYNGLLDAKSSLHRRNRWSRMDR